MFLVSDLSIYIFLQKRWNKMDQEMLHLVRAVPTKVRKHSMHSSGHYAIVIYGSDHWHAGAISKRNERYQLLNCYKYSGIYLNPNTYEYW